MESHAGCNQHMNAQAYPDALPKGYPLHWYVLDDVLGQGGFGITYRARDSNLDRTVAIKEYLPVETATRLPDATVSARTRSQAERYTAGLEGFLREARTLARFNHRNIVRVHSVFQHNNTAYMVMEYEAGETLAMLLGRRGTLTEAELTRMLLPIMDGLALVHDAGFIHRDIKPENIMLRPDGSAVLLDFGSARASMGRAGTMTILVAPGYAPYEQYYAGADSQGPWTDIYALAATCYRATTGEAPLDAIARSKGVLGSTRELLAPAVVVAAGRYSGRLLNAIDHALAFAEKDRPQSLKEWRAELVDGDPGAATSASPVMPLPSAVETKVPAPPVPVGRRELLAWVLAATGFGAAATALVLFTVMRPGGERDDGAGARIAATAPATQTGASPEVPRPAELAASLPGPAQAQALPPASASVPMPPSAQLAQRVETAPDDVLPEAPAPKTGPRATSARSAVTTTKGGAPSRPVAARAPAQVTLPAPEVPAASAKAEAAALAAAPQTAAPTASTPAPSVTAAAPGIVTAMTATATAAGTPNAAGPEPPKRPAVARARTEALEPPADEREAFSYYRRLALDGHSGAQFKLGELYATGRGVGQNLNQAYLWYGMAARAGHVQAKTRQAQVAANLQPAEVRQVDRYLQRQAPAASEARQ